jgi:hypothetical protein
MFISLLCQAPLDTNWELFILITINAKLYYHRYVTLMSNHGYYTVICTPSLIITCLPLEMFISMVTHIHDDDCDIHVLRYFCNNDLNCTRHIHAQIQHTHVITHQ